MLLLFTTTLPNYCYSGTGDTQSHKPVSARGDSGLSARIEQAVQRVATNLAIEQKLYYDVSFAAMVANVRLG